ncbi:CspA family cold shock protein [Alloalcanivorax xenomutans]|uniref:retron Se72 family effector protein n=1 Tax=Alloalcanivorax xenomutans TaxID=1094342 RepID=UPI000BCC099D|nr:CspA family cold shock protein [Alloalcanivorax xenomutans]
MPNHDTGTVTTFDRFKGFGFIRRDKGKDVFFMYDEVNGDDRILSVGDIVEFEVRLMPKGPRAFNIKKTGSLY